MMDCSNFYYINLYKFCDILELKFSVQNETNNQSLLTLILELNQLVADKRSVINISDEDLNNITLN